MSRHFNVAGPCINGRHYMLPAAERLPDVPKLIEQGACFTVHAPHQTGLTTTLRAIARQITAAGQYTALHFSCEKARVFDEDLGGAELQLLDSIRLQARIDLPPELRPPAPWPEAAPGSRLRYALTEWAMQSPRPLVLFIDEIDALTGRTLNSVLSQLRAAFPTRPHAAPWSIALCGMRDVDDDHASDADPTRREGAVPFNIKTESMRLADFTHAEVARLYHQHTEATGQSFTDEAIAHALHLTAGQPWLINALACEVIDGMSITDPIQRHHIEGACHRLIAARARITHLDALLTRLHEPRVQRIIEPILAGGTFTSDTFIEDRDYVRDLGLILTAPELRISNPIYAEVITRTLGPPLEANRLPGPNRYLRDGRLDLPALLTAFGDWWRQNGEIIAGQLHYHEVAPHLVLMAFLQRVVNGGGFVDREFGIGRRRLDLLIRWPLQGGAWQHEAIEIKVWSDEARRGDPTPSGLEQLDIDLTRLALDHGALVVFDRRAARPDIDDRLTLTQATTPTGRTAWILHA